VHHAAVDPTSTTVDALDRVEDTRAAHDDVLGSV
jgi:hypothetical protein